jgi:hypothetical protein
MSDFINDIVEWGKKQQPYDIDKTGWGFDHTLLKRIEENDISLKELELYLTHASLEQWEQFIDLLRNNKTITSIDMGHSNIDSSSLVKLIKMLETNSTIESLNLTDILYTDEHVETFVSVLQINKTLTELKLGMWGNDKFTHIEDLLSRNKYLKSQKGGSYINVYLENKDKYILLKK